MNYDVFISYNSADKQIADAVCHYLEERHLRCFIAPRNITSSDWAGSITAAIETARAFVIVVSENAIMSNEVAKEITLATRVSNYIFPFRIDNSELNGRMTYHLSAFHWIDAVTPPMEAKLNELCNRVEAALSGQTENVDSDSRNLKRQRLLGRTKFPRAEFIGRTRQLQEIDALFNDGNNSVFLCGMGGIGKSEIAKAYAKKHSDIYSTIVFASYETDLLHLIANDQTITVENLQQASATGGQGETIEDYYERKMKVLRSIVGKDTLIIIDNFDMEYDEHLEEVMQLPCKLLWTTRTDFSSYGYETVKIGPLDDFEDLVKLFFKIDRAYTSEADIKAVHEIIELLECHTFAISLTAAQMKASHMKPAKMLAQLKQDGLNIKTRSSFSRDAKPGRAKATAYEYIQALFDFSSLDDTSCNILRNLACGPREGVDIDLFMECAGIEDFENISRLIELNWVQMDEENDCISLHMLVREMVWNCLKPTLENCEVLLKGAYGWAQNAWNKSYDENCIHSPVIISLLENFQEPAIEVLDYFEEYATFAWIQGHFDLAEKCEQKLYALCVEAYGEISVKAGNQALRVAAVYHNMGDYVHARPWYEKGLEVQEAIDKESFDAYAARAKVARSDAQNGDYEIAEKNFLYNLNIIEGLHQKALNEGLSDEKIRKTNISLSFARLNTAHILYCLGRSEEALPYALSAYDYLKTDTVEPSLVIYAMMVLVYVYHGLKDYDRAVYYAGKSLEKNLYYRGETSIDTVLLYEMKGDLHVLNGQHEETMQQYSLALGLREKYFPADEKAVERLEEKYENTKQKKVSNLSLMDIWT